MRLIIEYNYQDIMRRKAQFCLAFLAVFVCILCTLLIDVFVKKGSVVFVKMSEELQIDAKVTPSMVKSSDRFDSHNFRLNFSRVQEL